MSTVESPPTFDLTDSYRTVQTLAREVARAAEAFAAEADAATDLHEPMRQLLQDSGLARWTVPRAYGGMVDPLDPLMIAVVREALMYTSAHLDSLFGMQGVGSYPLAVGGSEELRQRWLPLVASLDAIAAIALTEPEVGSDLRSISSELRAEGTKVRLHGRKSFITNGTAASFFCVLAREGEGYSMVLVSSDSPGVTVARGPDLIAPHLLGEIEFDGVALTENDRLGTPGQAFRLMLQTLGVYRVSVAASALGVGQAALDEAVAHTRAREQFGRPLLSLGAVSQSVAQSWVELETARAMTYRAAALARQDPFAALHYSSIAKVSATEAAGRIVDRSVQAMGRFGLVKGSKIERLYRNARPGRIYEGATEVLLDSLARRLVKDRDPG